LVTETLRRAAARIAANEFWLLWVYGAPLLFASNVPGWLLGGALLTIPVFWAARRVARGAWSAATPADLPLAVLLGAGLVGLAVSNDRATSARTVAELAGGVALYYGIVNGLTPAHVARGAGLLLALGLGFAVLGLAGLQVTGKFLSIPFLYELLGRVDLSFLNPRGFTPNIVAGAVLPAVPLAFGWGAAERGGRRLLLLGGGLVMSGVIVVTQSRGALLGLAVALAMLALWRAPRAVRVLAGVVMAGGLVWLAMAGNAALAPADDPTGTLRGRVELWERALYVLRDFPFTGIGPGTFEANVLTLYPLFENPPGAPQPHAHNLYLQMGVDYGIGGLMAFLAVVTTTLAAGAAKARGGGGAAFARFAPGLLAGYAAFLTHGLLDAVFVSTKVSVGVWILTGLLMLVRRADG
jgi:putative inorganic carbon (HCO3(-)) transporter